MLEEGDADLVKAAVRQADLRLRADSRGDAPASEATHELVQQ
jgi:hypothetical protein